MKTIYIKYICAICAICGLTACSDFLEEQKPQATLIQDEVKDAKYIDNVLVSAYAGLLSIEDMNSSFSLWNFDTRSDDNFVGGADFNDGPEFHKMEKGVGIMTTDWPYASIWTRLYKYLSRISLSLDMLAEADQSNNIIQERTAEMLFLRAYGHFQLKRLFKNIPFVNKPNLTEDDYLNLTNTEYTNDEAWQQIINDLEAAYKVLPLTQAEKKKLNQAPVDMASFRKREWVKGGIFSDVAHDDFAVHPTISTGLYRLRVPSWDNAKYAAPCEFNCPTGIPTQRRYDLIRLGKVDEAVQLELDYTPFPGSVCGSVCPNPCMDACTRGTIDEPIQIGPLGYLSAFTKVEPPKEHTGKKIAIVGGGVAGLSAAWQLARKGHSVTVYDEAKHIGGKLEQVIPRGRLHHELLESELKRIQSVGVEFVENCKVDKAKFAELQQESDAVIVATGGTKSRYFNWEGVENLTMGLEYLKAINRGEHPATGKRVVVIGAGNSGMDTCRGAYDMGAESVIAVDVQKPAAFPKEIAYVESCGGKLVWPFFTTKITKEGVYANDGRFIPADQVIVSIGEEPVLDFLPDDDHIRKFRGSWLIPDKNQSILPGVFTAGDTIKPGRLTDAIGSGRKAAWAVEQYLAGTDEPFPQKQRIPADRLAKAYFERCHHCELGDPVDDHTRCVSCGTCRDCKMCLESCPQKAITRIEHEDGSWEYQSDPNRCIGCGICAGVCPCGVWTIQDNPEPIKMYSTGQKA